MYKQLVFFLIAITVTSFSLKHKLKPVEQDKKSPSFFNLQIKDGLFYIPANYNGLSLPTAIVSSKQIPSWIFIGKQGQLCNQKNNKVSCSKVSSKIACEVGCQKQDQDSIISNNMVDISVLRKLKMNYQVNGTSFQGTFLQPSKVVYKSDNLVNKKIYAMVNYEDWHNAVIKADEGKFYLMITSNEELATFSNQKAIIVNQNSKKVMADREQQEKGIQTSQNNQNAAVQGSQNNEKNQNQDQNQQQVKRDQSKNTDKFSRESGFYVIANEQVSTKKSFQISGVQLNLQNPEEKTLFAVPTQIGRFLRKVVIKKYLKGDCDLKDNFISCKRKGQPQNIPIDLCLSQNNCIRINAESLVKSISKNKFELLFYDNDNSETNKQIVLNPAFLNMYSVLIQKGKVVQLLKNQKYQLASLESDEDDSALNAQEDSYKYAVNVQAKHDTNKRNYISTVIISILVYGLIALILLMLIKMKATQSFAAKTLDYAFGSIAAYFHRKKGYQAPILGEQIDDSNTMNVGYQKNDQKGKQMFWQKNSVEGI